jgi:hypothetical protein
VKLLFLLFLFLKKPCLLFSPIMQLKGYWGDITAEAANPARIRGDTGELNATQNR